MSEKENKLKKTIPGLWAYAESDYKKDELDSDIEQLELQSNPAECYTESELISTGGLKEVYKARDRKTGRYIAMAKLKANFVSPRNNERFLREARTLAGLEHSSIVPIYDISYDNDGKLFFTMKMLTGETLASVIGNIKSGVLKYQDQFSLRRLLDIFTRVCDAVSFAHSKGVVHLDLKPDNIQVSDYGEVYIMDWGMAKSIHQNKDAFEASMDLPAFAPLTSNITLAGNISGTPGYMSPEQARGEDNIREHSDIYSLGAILYTIIHLQRPYDGLKVEEIIKRTGEGIMPDFPVINGGGRVPPALLAITKKAMSLSPHDRYGSVNALQQDIVFYLNDFATQAESMNFFRFTSLFLKRHARTLSILVALCAVFSVVLFYSFSEIMKRDEILKAQNIKVNATADEIIAGTLQKHATLRKQHKYKEILANYEKLKNIGYEYPEFWYDRGGLEVGELNYKNALYYFDMVMKSKSPIKDTPEFEKSYATTIAGIKLIMAGNFSFEEIIKNLLNMDPETQKQAMWNFNRASDVPLDKRVEQMRKAILLYNKLIGERTLNFKYSTEGGYIKIDLSDTPNLTQTLPLYGMPINELNISKTAAHLGVLEDYLKDELTVLNASHTNYGITSSLTSQAKFEKLIARGTQYSAGRLSDMPNIKYLDIEGASVKAIMSESATLEYLNIAFTYLQDFGFLKKCTSLRTLVIDEAIILPDDVKAILHNNDVKIITKNKDTNEIPGTIQAEDYVRMEGINTNQANDYEGGLFVGWWEPGDFISHKVYVRKSGKYNVTFRLAGGHFGLILKCNDKILCEVNERGTTGWQDWTSISKEVHLDEGAITLTTECIEHGWNINWMKFELVKE
jgi:serine/threonine protein kinase